MQALCYDPTCSVTFFTTKAFRMPKILELPPGRIYCKHSATAQEMPGEVELGEMVSHTAGGERPVDNESVQKLEVSNVEKVQETAALWQRDILIYV